jgi:glycosyltransferase involved in cell wall biosynthesis
MKILQVITQSELGGAQTVVVQLANNLSKEHQVILVAGQGDGKMWDMVDDKVIRENCPHLQRSISLKNDLLAAIELRKLYNKYKPDIIHLHSSKAGTLGRIVFPLKKTVYTVHGFDSVRLAFRKFLPIERFLQYFCKAVVGVSKYDEKNLLAEGIKNNVSTVYNGISVPDCSQIGDIEVFNQNKKVVLTIARVFPQKKKKRLKRTYCRLFRMTCSRRYPLSVLLEVRLLN